MRLLGDCKSNFSNNPKTVIRISPNTSYLKKIIGVLLETLAAASSQTLHNPTEKRGCPQAAVAPPVINNGHIKS